MSEEMQGFRAELGRLGDQSAKLLELLTLLVHQSGSDTTTNSSSSRLSVRSGASGNNSILLPATRTGEYLDYISKCDQKWRATCTEDFSDDLNDEVAYINCCEDVRELNRIRLVYIK